MLLALKQVLSTDTDFGECFRLRFKRKITPVPESEAEEELIIVHIQGINNEPLTLEFTASEDAHVKADEFTQINKLPKSLVPILTEKIKESLKEHTISRALSSPSKLRKFPVNEDNHELSFGETQCSLNSMSFVHDYKSDDPEISYRRIRSTYSMDGLEASVSPLPRKMSRSLSFSPEKRSRSCSPGKLRNQDFYNRMHGDGAKKVERNELLKSLVLQDWDNQVLHSSFR